MTDTKQSPRRRVGNAEWDTVKSDMQVEQKFTKCPNCNRPLFAGVLGSGTHIEIECKSCRVKSQFRKP